MISGLSKSNRTDTGVRIITRGVHDWTSYFPAITAAAKALGPSTMILDGEAVVLDDKGLPNFGFLQQALGGRRATRAAREAIFYAFDLLYFDGHDLTGLELSSRRHMLTTLLSDRPGDAIRLSETIEADGESMLRNACARGLEGIIAKDKHSPYRSGRRGDWLKIKCSNSESFAVIGYEPSQKVRGSIASLLLAARKDEKLVYVGNVGTGFSAKLARDLRIQLDTMRTPQPASPVKGKGLVFVQPTLLAEVNFSTWTHDGNLRHPSFKGIREVADHAEVYELA